MNHVTKKLSSGILHQVKNENLYIVFLCCIYTYHNTSFTTVRGPRVAIAEDLSQYDPGC